MSLPSTYFVAHQFDEPQSLEDAEAVFKSSVSNVVVEITSHCNRHCTYARCRRSTGPARTSCFPTTSSTCCCAICPRSITTRVSASTSITSRRRIATSCCAALGNSVRRCRVPHLFQHQRRLPVARISEGHGRCGLVRALCDPACAGRERRMTIPMSSDGSPNYRRGCRSVSPCRLSCRARRCRAR